MDASFNEALVKLRAAANSDRVLEVAQMQLINIGEIIAAAGFGWSKLKEKIRFGTLSFLRGCLDDEDIVIPCDDGFLVIYENGDADAITRRTEEIRHLLIQFYLGQEGLERLRVQAGRQSMPARALHALASEDALIDVTAVTADPKTFLFAPIWHTKRRAVVAYFAGPVAGAPDGRAFVYDSGFGDSGLTKGDDYLAVDLGVLERARTYLETAPCGAAQAAIGVSVHASTLQRKARRALYLSQLNDVARRHRRLVSARVAEIGRGTPISVVAEWVGYLRAQLRFVYLQFHHLEAPPARLELTAATGAGFVVPLEINEERAPNVAFMHRVQLWAAYLAGRHMVLYIDNVGPGWLLERADKLGIQLVSSPHWPCVEHPGLQPARDRGT